MRFRSILTNKTGSRSRARLTHLKAFSEIVRLYYITLGHRSLLVALTLE